MLIFYFLPLRNGFSAVNYIMNKLRNHLNITERGEPRLFLKKKCETHVKQYLVSQNQSQGFH